MSPIAEGIPFCIVLLLALLFLPLCAPACADALFWRAVLKLALNMDIHSLPKIIISTNCLWLKSSLPPSVCQLSSYQLSATVTRRATLPPCILPLYHLATLPLCDSATLSTLQLSPFATKI